MRAVLTTIVCWSITLAFWSELPRRDHAPIPPPAPAPASATPPQAPTTKPGVPWDAMLLVGGDFNLEIAFDEHPRAFLIRGPIRYETLAFELVQLSEQGNAVEGRTEYRVHLVIDACNESEYVPPGMWPGPCGPMRDMPRPVVEETYDMLLSREHSGGPDAAFETERVHAVCVPTSSFGPSCDLTGTASRYANTRNVNGAPG